MQNSIIPTPYAERKELGLIYDQLACEKKLMDKLVQRIEDVHQGVKNNYRELNDLEKDYLPLLKSSIESMRSDLRDLAEVVDRMTALRKRENVLNDEMDEELDQKMTNKAELDAALEGIYYHNHYTWEYGYGTYWAEIAAQTWHDNINNVKDRFATPTDFVCEYFKRAITRVEREDVPAGKYIKAVGDDWS